MMDKKKLSVFSYLFTIQIIYEKFVIIIRLLHNWMIKLSDFLNFILKYMEKKSYMSCETHSGSTL